MSDHTVRMLAGALAPLVIAAYVLLVALLA